jgi:CRP-like cAMP-binding protein
MNREPVDPDANQFLAALGRRRHRTFWRRLVAVSLLDHEVLQEPGRPIEYVYFPKRGALLGLVAEVGDGRSFDAGLVGFEGMLGVELIFGAGEAQFTARVLAEGTAWRMRASTFRTELRGGAWTPLFHGYLQFLLRQFAQLAGCHRFHPVEKHFCSLLLRLQDRTGRADFELTHEHFARTMGVRRASITQVARKLQQAGLIRYRWGKISIMDRRQLEAQACICHERLEQACRQWLQFARPRR